MSKIDPERTVRTVKDESVVLVTGADIQRVARLVLNRELSGVELNRIRVTLDSGRSNRDVLIQGIICDMLNVKKLTRWDVSWTEYHEATVTTETMDEAIDVAAEYAGGHSTLMDSDSYTLREHVDLGDVPEALVHTVRTLFEVTEKDAQDMAKELSLSQLTPEELDRVRAWIDVSYDDRQDILETAVMEAKKEPEV